MIGAIAGDVIGSIHEYGRHKSVDFPLFSPDSTFTDDTVLTVAVAAAILDGRGYSETLREFGRRHRGRGYGMRFLEWLQMPVPAPYGSWGNGSAMRVSPVAWAFDTEERVLLEARNSAEVTHDHPEGIRGAEVVALTVYLARRGAGKAEIRRRIEETTPYRLDRTVDEIRPHHQFNESCAGNVPEAITCFLESTDFEHAIRLAVSLGGDADTLACIAGAIAEAHYGGVPEAIVAEVNARLTEDLREVIERFEARRRGAEPG